MKLPVFMVHPVGRKMSLFRRSRFPRDRQSGGRDENWLRHYKVIFLLTGCTVKTGSYTSFLGKTIEKTQILISGLQFLS